MPKKHRRKRRSAPRLHEKVTAVARLVDGCCTELLDVEHRTAGRRLLAVVAAADPGIFRPPS